MSLHKSSVLVKLIIKQWDAFQKDKVVADRIDQTYQTRAPAGNYNKRLLAKPVLAPVQKLAGKIRSEHNRLTMPWCYDGVSLLPSKLYFEYTELMRDMTGRFDAVVDNLITQYPIYKADRARELGALFNPDDYPNQDDLKRRFSVSYMFFPVPQSDHFIIDLERSDAERMKKSLQDELQNTQANALRELYNRVIHVVEHMHERLSDPENIFRDSLVSNVSELVAVLPRLNVFDDPTLNKACETLRERVLIAEPDDLRTDLTMRNNVANSAYDVVALLKGEHTGSLAAVA